MCIERSCVKRKRNFLCVYMYINIYIYILGCFPIFGGSSSLNGLFIIIIIIIIMVKRYLASRSGCFFSSCLMTSCLICSYSVGTSRLRFLSMYHLKFISMLMYLKAHCCKQSYTLPRHGRVLSSLPICLKAPTNPLYYCSVGLLRLIFLLKYIDNHAYLIESRCS